MLKNLFETNHLQILLVKQVAQWATFTHLEANIILWSSNAGNSELETVIRI